jgi:uncharacterized paraquat-inducible protein A
VSALRRDVDNQWDAPRQRPTAYALVALFMLLLANLFPFIYMKVGDHQRNELLEIPGVMFRKITPASAPFFTLCPDGPGFLPGHHSAAGQPRQDAAR